MKRPLAVMGYTYLAALAAALFLGVGTTALPAVVLLAGFAAAMKSKRLRQGKTIPAVLLTASAAMLILPLYTAVFVTPAASFAGQNVQAEAELCELPYTQYDRYYYPLKASSLTAEDGTVLTHTKLLVSSDEPLTVTPFDRLSGRIQLSRSTSAYQLSKGNVLTGYFPDAEHIAVTPTEQKPLFFYALQIRQTLSETLHELLPQEQADFMTALLLGDKTGVDLAVKEDLQAAGLSHIIVVSGMHLSLLTGLCLFVLTRLIRHKKAAVLLCILFVLVYMSVTGFSASIVRAGIMQIIFLSAFLFGQQADAFNSLGFAVLVMTLLNPYAATDISLLLSFSATLGILLFAQRFTNYSIEQAGLQESSRPLGKVNGRFPLFKPFINLLGVTLSAYVFTLPVTILYFHRIALYAVLANLATVPIILPLMISVVLLLLMHFSVLLSFLTVPLAAAVGFQADYITAVARQIADWPFAVLRLSQTFVPWWVAGAGGLAGLLFLCRKIPHRNRVFILTTVLSLIAGVAWTEISHLNVVNIVVPDTGEGVTVLLVKNNRAAVLSCGGNYSGFSPVRDYLDGAQVQKLSLLLMPNRDWAVSAYAEQLLNSYPTETVLLYDPQRWSLSVTQALTQAENCLTANSKTEPLRSILFEDKTIDCYEDTTHHAVFAEMDGYRVLVCTQESDAALLPQAWRKGDLLILHGRIDNKQVLSYDTVVVADTPENYRKYLSLKEKENTYYTWDGQNLIVRLYPDHTTDIRREQLWLS